MYNFLYLDDIRISFYMLVGRKDEVCFISRKNIESHRKQMLLCIANAPISVCALNYLRLRTLPLNSI